MSAASENLRNHQEQADRDGIMVKVSRQAVDETLAEYDSMLEALTKLCDFIDKEGPAAKEWEAISEWCAKGRAVEITNNAEQEFQCSVLNAAMQSDGLAGFGN